MAEYHIYGNFCYIFAYFGQKLVAMAASLRPLQSEMSCLDWSTMKTPVISNHILAISGRNSFICIYSNFSPKVDCRGNTPSSLCTKVSQMNSLIEQILSQKQTMHGCVEHNWSYGHFCYILLILAKIWLSWQHILDPCNQKCLLWISRPLKPYLEPKILSIIAVTQAKLCRSEGSRQV